MVEIYAKTLAKCPILAINDQLRIAPFRGECDIDRWLTVRNEAFRQVRPAGNDWNHARFMKEFFHKPHWSPNRLWLAEIDGTPAGTVYLAALPGETTGYLQWLAVRPQFQRQGVGAVLVTYLEREAFLAGVTTIRLETLSTWTGAVQLYTRLGYRSSSR